MSVHLPVKPISQLFPHLSMMGCEGIAAAMLLQYNHIDVSPQTIMKHWPVHPNNPEKGFAGNKYMVNFTVHQTIFPSAFAPYLQTYLPTVIDGSGASLEDLERVLDAGQPVLIYHTHLGFPAFYREFPTDTGMKRWVSNIHITLLTGYDEAHYYFIDPLWMQRFGVLLPAVIPGKAQTLKMAKNKMRRSYDAPGRLCIYNKVEIR